MNEVIYQNKRCVVSRVRGVVTELVTEEGRVIRIPSSECPTPVYIWRGVVPGSVRFNARPRSFLSELRSRRDIDLGKRLKDKRAKIPRVKGESKTSGSTRSSTHKLALQSAMNALSPEIAAMMAQQLSALSPKKPSKKKG